MITKENLIKLISEQKLVGYSEETIKNAFEKSNNDLDTVKAYFVKLYNKISVMSLSTIPNDLEDEILKAKKNKEEIQNRANKYYTIIEPYTEMSDELHQIEDNASELEEFALMIDDLIEILDVFKSVSKRRLKNYSI